MGTFLSIPSTSKSTNSGANEKVFYALVSMQGWRIAMEDAHAAVLDLEAANGKLNSFFAVYDGHGGSNVAKFAKYNVHQRLVKEEAYKNDDYEAALKNAFLGTDEDLLLADPTQSSNPSGGCTAVAALLTHDNKIYVSNAGDSRSVLGVKGQVKPLSFDHKPGNNDERARIRSAGGYIEAGRVNGSLALSRALGDFRYKKNSSLGPHAQAVTANPDVTCHEIMEDDEFFVLACDGIWDCLSSQDVVNFVRYQASLGKELTEIGEMICDHCLAPDTSRPDVGCDNMSVLIIAITHGRSKEEWYAWIADRVRNNYGYDTPSTLPQLYTHSRLVAFRAKKERFEKKAIREREEKAAAKRNASTSVQSAPSSTQACSQNDPSADSAIEDESTPSSTQACSQNDPSGDSAIEDESAPSSTQACSQNDLSADSASKDELPEPKEKTITG
jgi:protein phosphatase PTC2/3